MIKVLFAALKYNYGKVGSGFSVEYTNFYDTLRHMPGIEAEFFAVDEETEQFGYDVMNEHLIQTVQEKKPDLLFCYLLSEEIKRDTIKFITEKTGTKTFNWFADDHWRIPVFSKYWAPLFTLVGTTDSTAPAVYKSLGINNFIKTQWGANPYLYRLQDPAKNPGTYDITFVGKKYGNRGDYVTALERAGLPVTAFGSNWGGGWADQQKMIEIFSYSKINLNFTETYFYGFQEKAKMLLKLFIKKEHGSYKFTGGNIIGNVKSMVATQRRAIKGRVFEVPACGGFLLTGESDDDVSPYYEIGKEIVVFKNIDDMVEKAKYYLAHPEEREKIAKAGYERTMRDHTYLQRFEEIFKALELR